MSARIPPVALFGIATILGLSSTVQAWWIHQLTPDVRIPHLWQLLVLNLVYWYIPALVAPIIMRHARRPLVLELRVPAQVLVHIGGALAYALTHGAVMLATRAVLLPDFGKPAAFPTWWTFALREFLWQLDWMLMTYLFLVGLAYAFAYRQDSEAAAVNAANLETRLVEAQLQALQRQLHPHFLFNTLNTISGLVHTDPKAADRMLDRLGDLLRMTLHTSSIQQVRLREELEVLEKYLEIEQMRFGERLRVDIRIDPGTLDALVPNLLLQPLVENAIRHGIAPKARPGWLAIHAVRQGRDLRIEVRDSGDGMPPDRLMALNGGVGLENTRARLRHLYRSAFGFVFSNIEGGFCVAVTIPFQVEKVGAPAQQIA
jgi:two-component system, LytTR family, sensor kinase